MIFEESNGGKEINRDRRERTRPQIWIVNFKVWREREREREREQSLSDKLWRREKKKKERGKRVLPDLSNGETMRVREWTVESAE